MGAQKTATSHFQDTLAAMRGALRADGVAFLECRDVREAVAGLERWGGARALPGRLRRLAPDAPVAALSDENLMGTMLDALRARPWPGLTRRLRPLGGLGEVTVALSVRRWDRLWPAAYATGLRYRRRSAWLVRHRDALFARPAPAWEEVVARLALALPGARLVVWRQEDYAADPRPAVEAFLGRAVGAVPAMPRPPTTMTPSAEAVAEVEALVRAGEAWRDGGWHGRVNAIYARRPAGSGTPFRPMREDGGYGRDLAAIGRRWPGALVSARSRTGGGGWGG